MEDKQKVYIKGNSNRGAEVIKTLMDLGGRHTQPLLGTKEDAYYFINPEGVIDFAYTFNPSFPFVKEFYKEIKLTRWKPKYGDDYYYVGMDGHVKTDIWYDFIDNIRCYEFGNCFRTLKEAEAARDKIKEMLTKE